MARRLIERCMCTLKGPSALFMGPSRLKCVNRHYSESLPWEKTRYDAARVDLSRIPAHRWTQQLRDEFPKLLKEHISEWKSENRPAVWLHIPIYLGGLMPVASEQGFTLHHAKGKEIVMSRWLEVGRANKIPNYASHQVGVCGLVHREDTDEILVTQDKYKPPVWKFPGGIAEFAEDISDAAVREVKEETGIDAEFQSIVAFRQQHRLTNYYDLSDLYFICRLKPLTFDIHPCQDEIVKCQWMKLEELAVSKEATPLSHRAAQLLMEGRERGYRTIDISMEEWPLNFPGYAATKTYKLFLRTAESQST